MSRYRPNKDSLTASQKHNSKLLFEVAKNGDLERMKDILDDDMVGIADFKFILPEDTVVFQTTLTVFLSACNQEKADGHEIGTKAFEGAVLLVDHGADIMTMVHFKSNAIKEAVQMNMIDVANYLITAVSNISINMLNIFIFSCNSVEMLKLLMHHGADITSREKEGHTILMKNNMDESTQRKIRILALSYGVNVNAECMGGTTALHTAAIYGDLPSVKDLCEAGANLEIKDRHGNTPLETAIVWRRQHWKMREREPPQTNFNGVVGFLREEASHRYEEGLHYLSTVVEEPHTIGRGSTFSQLDRITQERIMSMVGHVPAHRDLS